MQEEAYRKPLLRVCTSCLDDSIFSPGQSDHVCAAQKRRSLLLGHIACAQCSCIRYWCPKLLCEVGVLEVRRWHPLFKSFNLIEPMHIVEKPFPQALWNSYQVLQKTGLVAVAAVDCLSISRVHRLHIVSFVCSIYGSSVGRILTINIILQKAQPWPAHPSWLRCALHLLSSWQFAVWHSLAPPAHRRNCEEHHLRLPPALLCRQFSWHPQLLWPLMAPLLWCWELAFFACWRLSAQSPASSAQLSRLSLTKCIFWSSPMPAECSKVARCAPATSRCDPVFLEQSWPCRKSAWEASSPTFACAWTTLPRRVIEQSSWRWPR